MKNGDRKWSERQLRKMSPYLIGKKNIYFYNMKMFKYPITYDPSSFGGFIIYVNLFYSLKKRNLQGS